MLSLSSKKSSLDKEVFKNYRPVSNLNFISKILERVVAVQLQTHLDEAGLSMVKGSVTALTLLDISTAFDTIDHTILLDRLNVYYGLGELALGWFKSYLSGRTHSVKVGSTLSHPAALQYGVPQGSLSLDQSCSLSTLTQSAQSFIPTVASSTTFTPMIPNYT